MYEESSSYGLNFTVRLVSRIGFDCRTPVCSTNSDGYGGYYHRDQETYVSGLETTSEIKIFEKYLHNNSYRLQWPYSNPNYDIQYEYYLSNVSDIIRNTRTLNGTRYRGPVNLTYDYSVGTYRRDISLQGGYRCSIRGVTPWENMTYLFTHPNYYSLYMDLHVQQDGKIYAYWRNMSWPPVYRKSKIIDITVFNITYVNTNEGFRRRGVWNRTENDWAYGVCILEFYRNCTGDRSRQYDIQSGLYNVHVQDTDLSYRARIDYDDLKVYAKGRWKEYEGTVCVDEVVRGCYNNGTCIAPNTCRCAPGW